MLDAVPAYSSLTIFYDSTAIKKIVHPPSTAYQWMKERAEEWMEEILLPENEEERMMRIPVCYETDLAPDINKVAALKNISVEELIHIHTARSYRVYMLGFLPGFAYMGEVDERISVPRKSQPVDIVEGSVGIAGGQTGIYPLASPGGWQIIGRTPVKLFTNGNEQPTYLQAGDSVRFYPISKNEFDTF